MKHERPTFSELRRVLSRWPNHFYPTKRVFGRGGSGIRYDIVQTLSRDHVAVITIREGPRARPRIAYIYRIQDTRKTIDFGPDGRPLRNLEVITVWGPLGPPVNDLEDA